MTLDAADLAQIKLLIDSALAAHTAPPTPVVPVQDPRPLGPKGLIGWVRNHSAAAVQSPIGTAALKDQPIANAEAVHLRKIPVGRLRFYDQGSISPAQMKAGGRGRSVANIKIALVSMGWLDAVAAVPEDTYDAALTSAVARYQRAQGWAGTAADGIVGPGTVAALRLYPRNRALHWEAPAATAGVVSADAIRAAYNRNGWLDESPPGMCLYLSQEVLGWPHIAPDAKAYYYLCEAQGLLRDVEDWATIPAGAMLLSPAGTHGHAWVSGGDGMGWSSDSGGTGHVEENYINHCVDQWGLDPVKFTTGPAAG